MNDIRLLIVEDDALVAEDMKEICTAAGYQVLKVAYSPGQALRAIEEMEFDLILMDINLESDVNGIEIVQHLRKQNLPIPIIYITSYFDQITVEQAGETMPMGYLVKPFAREQLLSTIAISLSRFSKSKFNATNITKAAFDKLAESPLTQKEWTILEYLLLAYTNRQIAEKEKLSVNTVKYHVKNIHEKLNVHTRAELLLLLNAL